MKKIVKLFKIIAIVIIITNLLTMFSYKVNAETSYSSMMQQAKDFIEKGSEQANSGNQIQMSSITNEFLPLGQILTTIGAGVMVAVTLYMGIKYLVSGPEAQAKLKQQLIGVVVSGIVIFGAYGIWRTVGQIVMTFDGT